MPSVTEYQLKSSDIITPDLSPLGEMIEKEILTITNHHPEIKIIRHVIMPDHIHIVLKVTEFEEYEMQCIEKIENGAIPISPAIHYAEKKIFNTAIEMGSAVIKLIDKGFGERYKPQGKDFDLCVEGRLLLLTPWPDNKSGKSEAGYAEFHSMNDYALEISQMSASSRMAIIQATSILTLSNKST